MEQELKIKEEYLEELLDFVGRSMVGKIMKRFEIIENKEILKTEIKELVYEEIRHFKNLILAYDKGLHITQFKIKTKEKNSTSK